MGVTKEDKKRNMELYKEGKRFCTECKEIKDVSEFYKSNTAKQATIPYTPLCKECCSKRDKLIYQRTKAWLLKKRKNKVKNKKKMNHTWEKIKKYEFRCKICGCIRISGTCKVDGKYYVHYTYERSGIVFSMDRPDCINWEEESKKTID